jgi:hypothetical protein
MEKYMKTLVLLLFLGSGNLLAQDAVPRDGNCPSGYYRDGNYCVTNAPLTPAKTYQRQADEANAAMFEKSRQHRESVRAYEEQQMRDRCAASGYGYSDGKCVRNY